MDFGYIFTLINTVPKTSINQNVGLNYGNVPHLQSYCSTPRFKATKYLRRLWDLVQVAGTNHFPMPFPLIRHLQSKKINNDQHSNRYKNSLF
jgi:hypothetical protein